MAAGQVEPFGKDSCSRSGFGMVPFIKAIRPKNVGSGTTVTMPVPYDPSQEQVARAAL